MYKMQLMVPELGVLVVTLLDYPDDPEAMEQALTSAYGVIIFTHKFSGRKFAAAVEGKEEALEGIVGHVERYIYAEDWMGFNDPSPSLSDLDITLQRMPGLAQARAFEAQHQNVPAVVH